MIEREAARVIVLDQEDHILLISGRDLTLPKVKPWWFTPGGGKDEGETLEGCAIRELREETGLIVDKLGSVIWERDAEFEFEGNRYRQHEHFFFLRTDRFDPQPRSLTPVEERSIIGYRWWSGPDISLSRDTFYPEYLQERFHELVDFEGSNPRNVY